MSRAKKLKILAENPLLLLELIGDIPKDILKVRRITNKWSIHEHVCHLADAQKMMMERFRIFKTVKNPVFKPFLPGTDSTPDDYLAKMDMEESMEQFIVDRTIMVEFLATFDTSDWKNVGQHPEYKRFTPEIFLRHILMHDFLHMYRIEELWLTNDEYLRKG